jgi:hypothetical protein
MSIAVYHNDYDHSLSRAGFRLIELSFIRASLSKHEQSIDNLTRIRAIDLSLCLPCAVDFCQAAWDRLE